MAKQRHTPQSLADEYRKQAKFLRTSCHLFDSGDLDEAARLATSLRVLFHDTVNSKSLLVQLGHKDQLRLPDTARTGPAAFPIGGFEIVLEAELETGKVIEMPFSRDRLVDVEFIDGRPQYVAPLGSAATHHLRPFVQWWDDKILDVGEGVKWSRRELVLEFAHGVGGAHVSPDGVDKRYRYLNRRGLDVEYSPDPTLDAKDFQYLVGDAAACSVRQVAYEAMVGLHRHEELQEWLRAPR